MTTRKPRSIVWLRYYVGINSLALALLGAAVPSASAQIIVPGADDSDGLFNPTSNITINLANSPDGAWDGPNPGGGEDAATKPLTGVYDASKRAIVFRFTSVNIPSGVTVTFNNHPKNAPVVWLVSSIATINGVVILNGSAGHISGNAALPSTPGPGGFRGGIGSRLGGASSGAGFGPGGAPWANPFRGRGGGYGTSGLANCEGVAGGPTYGNAQVQPLLGGSGGSGNRWANGDNAGGGAGGGAILIAAATAIQLGSQGAIRANGGDGNNGNGACILDNSSGGGSGGAIRLIADSVSGTGALSAVGGIFNTTSLGGSGRIRVEGNSVTLPASGPNYSLSPAGTVAALWPDSSAPSVRIIMVGDQSAPSDPASSFGFPNQDVSLANAGTTPVRIEATNMPINWTVTVRKVPLSGEDMKATAAFVSGDDTLSIWEAQVNMGIGFSAVQARAVAP